jgi:hypothetical protein
MYLRRGRVIGRIFAAALTHVSAAVTPPAPAAQTSEWASGGNAGGRVYYKRRVIQGGFSRNRCQAKLKFLDIKCVVELVLVLVVVVVVRGSALSSGTTERIRNRHRKKCCRWPGGDFFARDCAHAGGPVR